MAKMTADISIKKDPDELTFYADGKLTNFAQTRRCLKAVDRMKDFLFNAPQKVDVERLHFLLETYEESSNEPVIILRAKIFENLLHNKKLFIDDNPLVGTVTSQPAGVYIYPEWDSNWIIQEMNQAMMSHLGKVDITDEEKKIMRQAAKFFKNRSATAKAHEMSRQILGYDPKNDIKAGLFTETTTYTVGAGNVDYASFMNRGLGDIIRETEKRLLNLPLTRDNSSRIDFYRAALISMRSLVHLANRYADLAGEMASQASDQDRKAELLEITEVCRRVPENPPRNFREAIQSWWFLHLGIQIEQSGCGSSPGRLGQYLDNYYQKDKAAGMSREDAIAWLKCLFVKISEFGYYQGISYSKLTSGHTGHTINVGGLKANGEDATVELDYLLLDTQIDLRNIQPTITLLYHDKLKEDFLLKAVELDRTGLGQPQWMNNNVVIQRLLARHAKCGISLEDARNCINMSCVGTGVAGKTAFIRENATFNLAKCLELAMNDGLDPATGKQIGAHTGDPVTFTTFQQVLDAYDEQVQFMFKKIRPYGSIANKALADTVPGPFRSAMYGGCLERGQHEYDGGPDYYLYYTISTAGVDAANSLSAIKYAVFDTKQIAMQELKNALLKNFQGYEFVRSTCLEAPKHGNSDPEMDALVRRVYDNAFEAFHNVDANYYKHHTANIEAYSLSIHNYFGALTGALPSGRQAHAPLTDASVSATPGTDTKGPLALVRSAANALDTVKYGSNHFNMKFHPSSVAGINGARKLLALIKEYMDLGGSHIQFNIVDTKILREAQMVPDDYKDLTVRVAGFSAYFTRLHKGIQDEIIARTELQT